MCFCNMILSVIYKYWRKMLKLKYDTVHLMYTYQLSHFYFLQFIHLNHVYGGLYYLHRRICCTHS